MPGRTLRRTRREVVLAAIARREWLLSVMALSVAACRWGDDRARARKTTVTIAYEEKNLNPDYDEPDKRLVFLPLVIENEAGELEGRLAERWDHSADYREWTYHLRPDLRWHDGVPVTAADLKFSLDLHAHPDVLTFGPAAFESVTIQDPLTVSVRTGRFRFAEAYNTWPICYPKHRLQHLDPATIAGWDFWTHPIGNGPYRFVRYVPQQLIEFEANPDHYRGAPSIERVRLKFSRQASGTELLSENVDQSDLLDARQAATLAADARFRVYHALDTSILTLCWQHRHPCFRDPRVREALTLAINRRELRQLLGLPDSMPLVDGPFSLRQLQRGTVDAAPEHDPGRARLLLDAAGWLPRGAGQVRELDARPFRFTTIVRGGEITGGHAAAVYVQDQLLRAGVHMDIQMVDQASIYAQLRSGRFDAALVPARGREAWLLGAGSWIGYVNPASTELVDQLETTRDPNARDAIYRALADICRRDAPVTFLCPWVKTAIAHKRLRGLSSPWRVDAVQHMEELWIEE